MKTNIGKNLVSKKVMNLMISAICKRTAEANKKIFSPKLHSSIQITSQNLCEVIFYNLHTAF